MAAIQGRKIKAWLVLRGITMIDVAHAAGVDRSYVSHCLAGTRRANVVRNYLEQIGCPVEYLGKRKEAA
ncbi:helix-turn-helix transcriptional regulator [Desulfovibrio sulfodismutans]|uniref:Helix-turn-helix transcriptional regulator n=1 Tax=Desulfolutivibrio sulfodismutans TaxID=63561 RepID=A0A7K3NKL3_9BACT|nr:helix-turn-helix transcriptional regulator [Desulfolutivibrio sulfodismutans]NDY56295.1 helix-turn-helix transcriptional regulator [Desulfolutivibrio sulfodismutans]QLA13578.1 helix-turn-helix domain-containing protein [Desulfolutivibrio sulfodismutans DSM 3696]